MAKVKRNIIRIDEDKCDGCGLCVQACHEGAIQLVNSKAKLVSESYCDGLGDCLGECPRGAITIEEREAEPFDEQAVQMAKQRTLPCGCPGTNVQAWDCGCGEETQVPETQVGAKDAFLQTWPVQMRLVPPNAPFLSGAELVVAADCTPFAYGDFHNTFLRGGKRVCLVGCPKLDDAEYYKEKLAQIITMHHPPVIHVVYMEVPCCKGLVRLVEEAVETAQCNTTVKLVQIGIKGKVLQEETVRFRFADAG